MTDGSEKDRQLKSAIEPANGFFELGLYDEAWAALDELLPEEKAGPRIVALRLDILLVLHRLDDAVALGTGACRQWPTSGIFFAKTAAALMALKDYEKAKALLVAGPSSLRDVALFWFDLARCQARTNEIATAKNSLRECFHRDKTFRARALDESDLEEVWNSLPGNSPEP